MLTRELESGTLQLNSEAIGTAAAYASIINLELESLNMEIEDAKS